MKLLLTALHLAIALPVLASCAGEPGTGEAVDSTEWRVTNAPPYPTGELSPEPVLRIGALEGSAAVEFTDLVDVAVLADGRLVVVDRGPNEIRWFDERGALEVQAGGRGEGPGELMYPASATLVDGDTLVVFDARTQRLTTFGPSGSVVGTRGLEATSSYSTELGFGGSAGLLAVEMRATFAMGDERVQRDPRLPRADAPRPFGYCRGHGGCPAGAAVGDLAGPPGGRGDRHTPD